MMRSTLKGWSPFWYQFAPHRCHAQSLARPICVSHHVRVWDKKLCCLWLPDSLKQSYKECPRIIQKQPHWNISIYFTNLHDSSYTRTFPFLLSLLRLDLVFNFLRTTILLSTSEFNFLESHWYLCSGTFGNLALRLSGQTLMPCNWYLLRPVLPLLRTQGNQKMPCQ